MNREYKEEAASVAQSIRELASCAKRADAIETQRLECAIISKYKAGLLTSYDYLTLYRVAHTLREEARA